MTTPPPDHITRPDFGISVRGYDRAQVDAYFGRVVEWLADAENRALAAERSREAIAREVTELRAGMTKLEERAGLPAPQSMSAFSERMGQVMESALRAAQELRAEAEREARERREAASGDADRVLSEAHDEAERIVEEARRARGAMEEHLGALGAARTDALATIADLQDRLAAVVDDAGLESFVDGSGVRPRAGSSDDARGDDGLGGPDDDDDITTVVPAVAMDDVVIIDADPSGTGEILVTAAPTTVQAAVGRGDDTRAARPRRRSA
jgi:cell division septum initiation protein DivIVA